GADLAAVQDDYISRSRLLDALFHAKSDYLFPPDDMAKFVIFFAA
ncbi:hypothetical protein ACUOCP_52560, partial [Escherichia sp. R-CC3]